MQANKNLLKKVFSLFSKNKEVKKIVRKTDSIEFIDYQNNWFGVSKTDGLMSVYNKFVYGTYLKSLTSENRFREYHEMFMDSEIAYLIEEVVDEIVNEEDKDVLYINFDNDLAEEKINILKSEFKTLFKQLNLFDYTTNWELVKRWIIQGIIAFKIEYLVEDGVKYSIDKIEELIPYKLSKSKAPDGSDIYLYQETEKNKKNEAEVLLPEQILIIDSGLYLQGEPISLLEYLKKDFRRLALLEDAAVIYKLVRSPLRRIFHIYIGEMSPNDAEKYLKDFKMSLREDIDYNADKNEFIKINPLSLLDDYYFPKNDDGDLVSVDTLEERANDWSILKEISYFLKKMYRALKVPSSRINIDVEGGTPAIALGSRLGEITREELKLAKFVKRLQSRFSNGFYEEIFWRHLFFKDLINKLSLKRNDFNIKFFKPTHYDELKTAEVWDTRINNFSQLINNEGISFSFALKKFLKLTDDEIKQNKEMKIEDIKFQKTLESIQTGEIDETNFLGGGGMPPGGTKEMLSSIETPSGEEANPIEAPPGEEANPIEAPSVEEANPIEAPPIGEE